MMNQRKTTPTIFKIILAIMLMSLPGPGRLFDPLTVAHAQSKAENQLVPGTAAVEPSTEAAILRSLDDFYTVSDLDLHSFAITDIREMENWALVSLLGLAGYNGNKGWSLESNGAWFGLVLIKGYKTTTPVAAIQGTLQYSTMLGDVPDAFLDSAAKQNLDPLRESSLNSPDSSLTSYVFPWQPGTSMYYGSLGLHANGFSSVVPGWKAVDMASDGNTALGHAPNRLLASETASISYVCNDGISVAVKMGNFFYTHLLDNSNLYVGKTFSQGAELGTLKTGSFDERCGYANQGNGWFHVHWGFPNADLHIDTWTLSMSTGNWTNGNQTITPDGGWIKASDHGLPPDIAWNTFLGGADLDSTSRIDTDGEGNVYIVGSSSATWGLPLRPFAGSGPSGSSDVFVAKLNQYGDLLWHTFLGGTGDDTAGVVGLDEAGNIYVTGSSYTSWGTPIRSFNGSSIYPDSFIARLNGNGELQWNTFLGVYNIGDIALDDNGFVYVVENVYSTTSQTWQSMSVSKWGGTGSLIWRVSLANTSSAGNSIAVGVDGSIYVAGHSWNTWGAPLHPFAGKIDVFLARLNSSGTKQWSTFIGGTGEGDDYDLALDGEGSILLLGKYSPANGFVARFNDSGLLQWDVPLDPSEAGGGMVLDNHGNIYVVGNSQESWGTPINPFTDFLDTYVAKLDKNGTLIWNTFLGGTNADYGLGIGLDERGDIYVAGYSNATWGAPLDPYVGSNDAYVVKLSGAPFVRSLTRTDASPTNSSVVRYRVIFSETVTGVDANDFSLNVSGVTGASVSSVSGSGSTYTIKVNTGTGNGDLRLDIVDNDSIIDGRSYPLGGLGPGNGSFISGETYTLTGGLNVTVGAQSLGTYAISPATTLKFSPPNLLDGPVRITGTRTGNLFTSQRVVSGSSFNEVMGIPTSQLTTEYWFPWYDNVSMTTWILVGNASGTQAAAVDIYVGSSKTSYSIPVNGRITPRFDGIVDGPVRVVSTNGAKIFTSERAVYKGAFNEVMGYPASQFATEYWFPYYDNVSMSTWILVGNPSTTSSANVDLYVGGVKQASYTIPKGGRVTPRFALQDGPVRVVSTNGVKIFASERTLYGDSFNEVMGYPASLLTTEYRFPWYDNVSMAAWVLVGNPSTNSSANVEVYIGTTKYTYTIPAGGRITPRYSGKDIGPVRVRSTNGVKVFTSQRVLFGTIFNEVMGYPGSQLTMEYWFPWYDSTSMSTDILVGRP